MVQQATPTQITNYIIDAKNWNAANPSVAVANTVIVYAWNEFNEGGWLCLTSQITADPLELLQLVQF